MAHAFETHRGSCHCGAIRAELSFTRPAEAIEVRSCQCGFCTRHGSLTVSDPMGRAVFEIDAAHVGRYTFGTATAKSVVCGRCGVYAGALLVDGENVWSIANARGLAIAAFASRVGMQMIYEAETADQRVARRKQKWTPTEIRLKL